MLTYLQNIIELNNKIEELKIQISEEKTKIINLNYVQSKLNKPIKHINKYIQTIKYLDNPLKK